MTGKFGGKLTFDANIQVVGDDLIVVKPKQIAKAEDEE